MAIIRHTQAALALMLAATVGSSALAQTGSTAARYPGTDYLNGGIGTEQADRMRAMSADFPVQMTFAERNQGSDEFVADVHLRVTDESGRTVIDLPSQGPIFLLQVPPGSSLTVQFTSLGGTYDAAASLSVAEPRSAYW